MSKRKPKDKTTMSETIRTTIHDSGLTLYRVAKDAGVAYAPLHRFMNGERGLSVESLDKLCGFLGLELTKRK